nr:hypothetical protein [Tanacetum cinerariifolium]
MILSGADNRPPMLDKDVYDSWKSRMELYMQNREHKRMILESVKDCPLIWPTIKENGETRTKKYANLSAAEKIQADWTSLTKQERDCKLYDAFDKFTHIKGLPPEWSKFVTDVKLVKDLHTTNFDQLHAYLVQHELYANEVRLMRKRNQDPLAFVSPFVDSDFVIPIFSLGDDPISYLNKAMAFLTVVAFSRFSSTNNQLRTSSNTRNQATIQDGRVTVQQVQGRQWQSYFGIGNKSNATSFEETMGFSRPTFPTMVLTLSQ